MKIYIASPLGFSESGREYLYNILIPKIIQKDCEVIDPWKLTDEELIKNVESLELSIEKYNKWTEVNVIIGKNNVLGIEKSDGLLAVLDGPDVDSGTASEIGYAAALGKKIVGFRSDFRLAGDNIGSIINLQVEYFIKMTGGKIYNSIEDSILELKALLN